MFHYSDYLRDQAREYRRLAEEATDPLVKAELLELAADCEEIALKIDDRRASG
jgi:hypothetical protein